MASAVDLRLAAECAHATVAEMQHFNPSLLHLLAPQGFELKIPSGTADGFREALAMVPAEKRLQWRVHWVAAGETWGQLSRRYQVSVAKLRSANPGAPVQPAPDTPVVLPLAGAPPASSSKSRKNP